MGEGGGGWGKEGGRGPGGEGGGRVLFTADRFNTYVRETIKKT